MKNLFADEIAQRMHTKSCGAHHDLIYNVINECALFLIFNVLTQAL